MRLLRVFSLLLLLASPLLPSQEFRQDSGLVLVRVTVMDRKGATVRGLEKGSFTLLDDGFPRTISTFYAEDAPCTVGFVLDARGSMSQWADRESVAARAFLEVANPGDDSFVTIASSGGTALYDGIHLAATRARKSARQCRALVVFSDGMDNHSRTSRRTLLEFLKQADVRVFAIAIGERSSRGGRRIAEEYNATSFLDEMAAVTGGFAIMHPTDLSKAAKRISAALRDRYVLGFQAVDGSEKWRRIQVQVNASRARVYAPSGYHLAKPR